MGRAWIRRTWSALAAALLATRPIRLILPTTPGGLVDLLAHVLVDAIAPILVGVIAEHFETWPALTNAGQFEG